MSSVETSDQGRIRVVTINRPERRNAVDCATADRLADAFAEYDSSDQLDVAILTGADGTFCSGADLKAMAEGEPNRVALDGPGPMGPTRMRLSKPVLAAIEGYAVAGGLELALWCDMRVAAEDAVLGVFSRRFGVPLIDMGTIRLPRIVGHGRAMDLILTGRPITAGEALDMGLVNRVVPAGQALAEAMTLAEAIVEKPQSCLRNDRLSAIEQWDLVESEAIRNELQHGMRTIASGELQSGAEAFDQGFGRHGG